MAGVSKTLTIRDNMSAKLDRISAATERTNRALETMDRLVIEIDLNEAFTDASISANRAAGSVDNLVRSQQRAENSANNIASAWSKIKKKISAIATAFAVKEVIELADAMSQTKARLTQITGDLQKAEALQKQIADSANRSRASYLATADAVAKMGTMAKGAFQNTDELVKFTELVNKQFVLAGTSFQGASAALTQLTQAMSSGVLRGDELNSIFEQAPTIIETIASYLNVPICKIREMAAEGQITSDIVKNAMLAAASDIDARFSAMPMTWGQLWNLVTNALLQVFTPVLETIAAGAGWIYDNWSMIAPVFWGLAAAVIFYATALGIKTVATWLAADATKAFFTTLLTNPIFWVAMAIGFVVAFIYDWIQAVGGLKNAWAIAQASLIVAWKALWVAFVGVYNWMMGLIDKLKIAWQMAGMAITNFMGDMAVGVLTVLQEMINGAINIINDFIKVLNLIPGVNIDLVQHVTFATTASLENEAAKRARAGALKQYEGDLKAAKRQRDLAYFEAKRELAEANKNREDLIQSSKKAAPKNKAAELRSWEVPAPGEVGGKGDIGNVDSVGSIGKIDSEVNIAEEDIKFLRDIAEMRYIQNFVTLTPTVSVDAVINEKADADEIIAEIERRLEDEFVATAEGVYN